MKEKEIDIKVDSFRFINHLHTTVRQLFICSEVVLQLNEKQLPKDLLLKLLYKWSKEQESINEIYKNSKGKLTDKGKETSAVNHYLDLCNSLGLVTHLNGFYSNKRLSRILLYFINKDCKRFEITIQEKLFYLFQLLSIDADGILLVLSLLENVANKNQIELQKEFKDALNKRLLSKQELASQIIKTSIGEKYRTINFIWKRPEKYAEHILIPRCEWLSSIGLLSIEKKGSSTIYSLTGAGINFYSNIPLLSNSSLTRDINEHWMNQQIFTLFDTVFPDSRVRYKDLEHNKAKECLGFALKKASTIVKTSNTFRIPLFDTLVFICLYLFIEKKIIINFSNIYEELKGKFSFENKQYLLKEAGRINEGYITTITIG